MITLDQFVKNNTNKKLGVPWNPTALVGQCVSLVQWYLKDCLNQPAKARGNAKDWATTYPKEGLGKVVTGVPEKGDIIVWGTNYGGGYGHIAVYLGNNQIFEQNQKATNNYYAGVGKLYGTYTILRPNVKNNGTETSPKVETYTKGTYLCLSDLNIRSGAGTNHKIVKVSQTTQAARNAVTSKTLSADATFKKGTKITALDIIAHKDGSVWLRNYSGYCCIKGTSGKIYCSKVDY